MRLTFGGETGCNLGFLMLSLLGLLGLYMSFSALQQQDSDRTNFYDPPLIGACACACARVWLQFSDDDGGDDEADDEGGEDDGDDLTASHPEV